MKLLKALPLLLLTLSASAQPFDCFGVIAGKNATADGVVYLAHNEDQNGFRMLNIYNVAANKKHGAYLWFEWPGVRNGDNYLNEYGVFLTSDRCNSREDKATGKILYDVRNSIGPKAKTAREAVKMIGKLVEKYGYDDSGRSYLVADANEGWVCSVVKGKHWIAHRVPDDEVMTIPNYYVIGEIDLKDKDNWMGGKDVVKYAIQRGWYNPERDGKFNFRKVYSSSKSYNTPRNSNRHKLAQETLIGDALLGDDVVFSRKPKEKVTREALTQLLCTPPIYNANTVLSTVAVLYPGKDAVVWTGFPGMKAEEHFKLTVFDPVPANYHRYATPEEAAKNHFTEVKGLREKWPAHFYWNYFKKPEK